jgi:hypothetical protein
MVGLIVSSPTEIECTLDLPQMRSSLCAVLANPAERWIAADAPGARPGSMWDVGTGESLSGARGPGKGWEPLRTGRP